MKKLTKNNLEQKKQFIVWKQASNGKKFSKLFDEGVKSLYGGDDSWANLRKPLKRRWL